MNAKGLKHKNPKGVCSRKMKEVGGVRTPVPSTTRGNGISGTSFEPPMFFFFFFLIDNQINIINEKSKEKYKLFMMMTNRK